MKDEELQQWVREQVAKMFYKSSPIPFGMNNHEPWENMHYPQVKEVYYKRADKLLQLLKPDGTPAIGIISDDQKHPKEIIIYWDDDPKLPLRSLIGDDKYVEQTYKEWGFVRLVGGKDARD